jgi:hypothetical protein
MDLNQGSPETERKKLKKNFERDNENYVLQKQVSYMKVTFFQMRRRII